MLEMVMVFHIPWLRSSSYTKTSPKLPIRLAGIDAPEVRYFNKPEQPHAIESKNFLKSLVLNKMVYVEVLDVDMYSRIVAIVHVKLGWFSWTNVNVIAVKEGMACVYVGGGAAYGNYKEKLLAAQELAKTKKIGMWKYKNVVLPGEYKSKYRS